MASTRQILGERYGARYRPIRTSPLAHHVMGGLCAEANGATSVAGLFAAGEGCGGLHGANRMGGNALTETVVFGARAGQAAGDWARNIQPGVDGDANLMGKMSEPALRTSPGTDDQKASRLMADLRHIMWREGGIQRNEPGLSRALEAVRTIKDQAADLSGQGDPRQVRQNLELYADASFAAALRKLGISRYSCVFAHCRKSAATPKTAN